MNLVRDPRAAGNVRRYHTWAVIKEQTVAEHTWQIMRILLTVWPEAPRKVIVHALMHDAGEMSGDIQYPFKLMFTELKSGSEKAENYVRKAQQETGAPPEAAHPLSTFERHVFKCCDNLEMWEYGLREVNLGNRYALIIVNRMQRAVAQNIADILSQEGTQQFQQNVGVVPAIHRYFHNRLAMEKFDGEE
jgi:5'-deoxynucleotidase YfbR-like HD superfamily hydrolase